MNAKTLRALKGSIKKWEKIAAGKGVDEGPDNCPLCKLFWSENFDCKGCPVSARAGMGGCRGTPYDEWALAVEFKDDLKADTPRLKAIARKELRFLRSLLPKATGRENVLV
jgi:hypothetical protein